MAKYTLDNDFDFDFDLIGISCHEKSHKLAWLINIQLNVEFKRTNDHIIISKKNKQKHTIFEFIDEKTEESYYLLKNKSEFGYITKEQKSLDYFLMIKNTSKTKKTPLIKKIREIKTVLLISELNILELKSKENFIL